MIATADLKSEHVGVGRMLGVMDEMAARARTGERLDADDLAQVVEFLRVFVDRCHHTKEERQLFQAIRAANMASVGETVVGPLAEHVQGREAVARIAAATERLAEGDESANAELAQAMPAYTQFLRDHIRREEADCFDAADRELPLPVQENLAERYERIEYEVVGEGVHERFHALLDRLTRTYHA